MSNSESTSTSSSHSARRATYRDTEHIDQQPGAPWFAIAGVLCLLFLVFIAGSFIMFRGIFPADPLRRAFQGGEALYRQFFDYRDPVMTDDFWQNARSNAQGVTYYDPAAAQNGLTLYTSGHEQKIFLIDMEGNVVHEWGLPYSAFWDENSSVKAPRPDEWIWIEKARVLPDGSVLALYVASGDTPWGYGLVKLNANSEVEWKYLEHAHHAFDIDEDGNIYVLTHEISETDLPGFDELPKPRVDDFIVKLSPDGRELEKLWLSGTFAASPQGRRLYFVPWQARQGNGDYLHSNSVQVLRAPVPGIPQSRAGQVLISMRELSTIGLFDLETHEMVWSASGPWVRQHDAEFLPNGNVLLFDNEGAPQGEGISRVMEFNPQTYEVVWSYGGREGQPLESNARSSQERLPNGNTLIVESLAGRLLEVTPEGRIVWEYLNPVRGGPDNSRIPIIFWVQRLDPQQYFTPAFQQTLGMDD